MVKRCFVIAPIGEPGSRIRRRSDRVLEEIIRPAVKECGYKAVRADEIDDPGVITKQVVRHISTDALVVADLTGHNPNVFYELAIRHSLRKPLIQLIAQGEQIPFDVREMRTIHVNHRAPHGREAARQEIVRQVRALEKGTRMQTPIDIEPMEEGRIEGKRLFQHRGYYPIDIARKTNLPSLNRKIFVKALRHFLDRRNYDRLAAMDLVYLREDNLVDKGDIVADVDLPLYWRLVEKYDLLEFIEDFPKENERIFNNFVRIVNDLGDTLKDIHFEVLLHNVRNPIRSIIAARNSEKISGRKLFDPSTRFVVQFVKNQGRLLIRAMKGGSKVSYLKQFSLHKKVKATTTPLYHERYGLIGILCLNIDIDSVMRLNKNGRDTFWKNYVANSGRTPRFEKLGVR
jgi:YheO-like PAS domain-containing protein